MNRAVFLDRDGVINVDVGYPHRLEDLSFIDGASDAIKMLNDRGYLVIVVTNQSGVARGLFGERDVDKFHGHIQFNLGLNSARIDRFYYCPFHPDGIVSAYSFDHEDRKPSPGMIERAIKDYEIDRSQSFLVGDKMTDIIAAERAGVRGFLFKGGSLFKFISEILSY